MAQITRYTAHTPPAAPEREATSHQLLRVWAAFALFSGMAHAFWWNLLGIAGGAVVLAVTTLGAIAFWIPVIRRSGLRWRRLPWTALAYVAWGLVSLIWSAWPGATLLTWPLLAGCTLQALFFAHTLTWAEIVRALDVALKWVMGLSIAIELWVALIRRAPLLPNFADAPADPDPQWYWVRGNLFEGIVGERIQGIVGNANYLGILCVLAIAVFAVRYASRPPYAPVQIVWIVLTAILFVRAGSATALVCAAGATAVLVTVLLMRRARTAGDRRRLYLLFVGVGAIAIALALALWDRVLPLLGREATLTDRDRIWAAVWERAVTHPVHGNGFSSPWVPMDPAFDGWIVDHGISVFHAHNMWLDAFLQLGAVGVLLLGLAYAALTWRSWFFAVDRPRWDLEADRPFSPLSLLPPLLAVMLLLQGLTESGPIMLWGWTLAVLFSFKIKLAPIVGHDGDQPALGTPRR